MAQTLTKDPAKEDYITLSDYEKLTPDTFFAHKPILHFHSQAALRVPTLDLSLRPDFASLFPNYTNATEEEETIVDIWVFSTHLDLWSRLTRRGVRFRYQMITMHALENQTVIYEIALSDPNDPGDDEEEREFLHLRLSPIGPGDVKKLYQASVACQELNPSPRDDDGDEDMTAPGATGWITSDNIDNYRNMFDSNGDTSMGNSDVPQQKGPLGTGAGKRRRRETVDNTDSWFHKWQRTNDYVD
ncbi:hypothetical protein K470DRAFT_259646 [Piedraia hortae CBS 480.64]|uniref:Uncharacterized protein n=1 Tax=Piedraia hortae CBS 480.64 TaxID=1314780 RepID=A0A6A7BTA5_9PEZI|nr:hypothetical protein K470DRAFT_259646 [Piedraia hortae CBS 480.64]